MIHHKKRERKTDRQQIYLKGPQGAFKAQKILCPKGRGLIKRGPRKKTPKKRFYPPKGIKVNPFRGGQKHQGKIGPGKRGFKREKEKSPKRVFWS